MHLNEVYFQFKTHYQKSFGEKAYLGDFIDLTGTEDIIKSVERIPIFPYGINNPVRLTTIQVIDLIHREIGVDISIIPIGDSSALFEAKQKKNENPLLAFFRVAFSLLLIFCGSALAVMYFHSDVNMIEVHQTVYYLISGQRTDNPIILSLSYSLGIGMGIAIYFEVFERMNNKKNPGPLELEMYQSKKEMHDYLMDQEGEKET